MTNTQPDDDTVVEVTTSSSPTLEDVVADNAVDDVQLSDRGNGRRFAEMYRHIARCVVDHKNGNTWIVRTGEHWALDEAQLGVFRLTAGVIRQVRAEALRPSGGVDPEERRRTYLNFALRSESNESRLRMISSAREHPEMIVREDDLDADPNALAVPNGVVDLSTGELRRSRPDDLCTRVTTVSYDPDATSPELDRYLDTFVPDPEDQEVLFAVLGSCFRGNNSARMLPFFVGGTTSGKSQLVAALHRLAGKYMCAISASIFRGNIDDKPRPDLVRAMYHRIACAVEASKVWELHADQVKRLTGGVDPISYRDHYSGTIEKVPRFTPLIVTNEVPRVKGADPSFKRRMITVRFDRTLPPELEDIKIKEKFINDEGCLRALLARIVVGARSKFFVDGIRWSQLPERYAEATLESFGQLDHVDEFLQWLRDEEILQVVDMSETPVSHCAKASDLHAWYKTWVKKHGDKQDRSEELKLADFGAALRTRGWMSKPSGGTRWLGARLTRSPSLWMS